MEKRNEISSPTSCLNKALDGELIFVLLGRDETAAETIRDWIGRRISKGLNYPDDGQMIEALDIADEMDLRRAMIKAQLRDRKNGP